MLALPDCCWSGIFDATLTGKSLARPRYKAYHLMRLTLCETNDLGKELETASILDSRVHTGAAQVPSMESGTHLSESDAASSHQQSELLPYFFSSG